MSDHDIEFLSSIANIAAAAVDTMKRDAALRVAADRLQDVIEDQERLAKRRTYYWMRKFGLNEKIFEGRLATWGSEQPPACLCNAR